MADEERIAEGAGESKNAYAPELLDVEGFRFLTKPDADKAKIDAGKIAHIESHVGYTTATALMAVYGKSIQNKIFGTPVGWSFLQDLRKRLIKMGVNESELEPIPMTVSFTHQPVQAPEQLVPPPEKPKRRRENESKPPSLILSVVLNLVLIAVIIAMFVILNTGETDNMLNYKQNITNRYAAWEEELRTREQTIRDKEKELRIGSDTENTSESGENENDGP